MGSVVRLVKMHGRSAIIAYTGINAMTYLASVGVAVASPKTPAELIGNSAKTVKGLGFSSTGSRLESLSDFANDRPVAAYGLAGYAINMFLEPIRLVGTIKFAPRITAALSPAMLTAGTVGCVVGSSALFGTIVYNSFRKIDKQE